MGTTIPRDRLIEEGHENFHNIKNGKSIKDTLPPLKNEKIIIPRMKHENSENFLL